MGKGSKVFASFILSKWFVPLSRQTEKDMFTIFEGFDGE